MRKKKDSLCSMFPEKDSFWLVTSDEPETREVFRQHPAAMKRSIEMISKGFKGVRLWCIRKMKWLLE